MESDCLELVEAFKGESDIWSSYTPILIDCFDLAHGIPSISFQHWPREANNLAHFVARYSNEQGSSFEWVDEAPNFLLSHLLSDVTLPAKR